MSPAPKCCPQEQESQILAAAAECIEETSLLDFTMSQVAKRAGMSMGSIYKHVHSKEDVLIALATCGFRNLNEVFGRILVTPLSIPEQLIAISLLDFNRVDSYPFSRYLEMLVSNEALVKRASANWLEKMQAANENVSKLFNAHFQSAIERGELIADGDIDSYVEELNMGIWAMNVGYIQVALQVHALDMSEVERMPFPLSGDDPHILNSQRLINSYRWQKPLDNKGILRAIDTLQNLGFR